MQCCAGALSPMRRVFLYSLVSLNPSFDIVFNFETLACSFCSIEILVDQVLLRELGISFLLAMFNKSAGMSCRLE